MKKIFTVIGARPQFIKCCPVSLALEQSSLLEESIIHTGQHFDPLMSDVFFNELNLTNPIYNLGVNSRSHGVMTAEMLIGLEEIFIKDRPNMVLVYGDTNSTLAATLAASKLNIRIAHVEAGLRSFNMNMPEEINRVITDRVSDLLFAPTLKAMNNLRAEGFSDTSIFKVGDVMFDLAQKYSMVADRKSTFTEKFNANREDFILVTIHRAENTESIPRLKNILDAVTALSNDFKIIWPIHPRTKLKLISKDLLNEKRHNFDFIEPLGYFDMVTAEKTSRLIVTDSGGVQKEAYFHSIPCVTLRDETEWTELVEAGWNKLCTPTSSKAIISAVKDQLNVKVKSSNFYGDGKAATKIVDLLESFF